MSEEARVVIVSTHALPNVGGVEVYTAALARGLERCGWRATLVTTTRDAPEPAIILRSIAMLGGRVPLPFSVPEIVRALRACYGSQQRCVTIVQTRLYPLGLIFALAARWRRRPVVVLEHGSGHVPAGSSLAQRFCDACEHLATLLYRACGARFWAVSPASAEWLRHFGVRPARVLPNAVEESLVALGLEQRQCVSGEPVALYAGRLIEEKGVLDSIAAVELLRARGLSWRLEIAGSGPLERTVAARAAETEGVTFLGALEHSDLIAALRCADALVFPSRYPEAFSTIVLEAGALGVPIVATARGGVAHLLGGGARGLVLADGAPETIASALEELRSAAGRTEGRVVAMREFVSNHHTWPAVIAPAAGDLRGMLGEHARAT